MRLLNPSNLSLSLLPALRSGILHAAAPGKMSLLYAYPTSQPTAATIAEPGNCDSAS